MTLLCVCYLLNSSIKIITVCAIPYEQLYFLQPHFVCWYIITSLSSIWKVWIVIFKIKVTLKGRMLKKKKKEKKRELFGFHIFWHAELSNLVWLFNMVRQKGVWNVWSSLQHQSVKERVSVYVYLCLLNFTTSCCQNWYVGVSLLAHASAQHHCGTVQSRWCNCYWGNYKQSIWMWQALRISGGLVAACLIQTLWRRATSVFFFVFF